MSRLQTMGTSSCATGAIGFFKNTEEANEKYKADPKEFRKNFKHDDLTVNEFYNQVLYPTRQDLGRTSNMPFRMLMDDILNSPMHTKFLIATLNDTQFHQKYNDIDQYWVRELEAYDFIVIDETINSIGKMRNYVFVRNPNRPEKAKGKYINE